MTLLAFELTDREGEFLVSLARKAAEEYISNKKVIPVPKETPAKLLERCGVFVTINSVKHGEKELRGCIGLPYPTEPLAEAVIQAAISSATQDPRFYGLTLRELDTVVFEISVLTPPEKIEANKAIEHPSRINVGKDGLIVERGMFKGLLLPQVPVECHWDSEEFISQCCIKAGLPPDNWLLPGTNVYKFQAIIFDEASPKGEVKRRSLGKE